MKILLATILLSLSMGIQAGYAETRIWTDKKGNTIEAEFVNLVAGKVILKTTKGKQIKVPQNGLSSADQKFLENAIPPDIDIDVNIDNDSEKISESYSYTRSREKVKGSVTITKKNREPSNKKFKATLYLFSENLASKELTVIAKSEHDFSFEKSNKVIFSGDKGQAEYTNRESYSSSGKTGDKYEGYLAVIEDPSGKIVHVKGSRPLFENQAVKILKAKKNSKFDSKFRKIGN